jgi:tubulysin polyketide synthase-like protein
MSAAAELLADLERRGVRLAASGDTIRIAPKGRLSAAELAMLRARKPELLQLLQAPANLTEHHLHVPAHDPETVREVLGTAPTAADREALHHQVACAVWDLRERQAGRQPWGGVLLVRGRPLADWLSLDTIADLLRERRHA